MKSQNKKLQIVETKINEMFLETQLTSTSKDI